MKHEFVELLRCPRTGQRLTVSEVEMVDGEIRTAELLSEDGSHRYPVREFVPRFVPPENYATGFGLQWNWFRETQLDSRSGVPVSRDRFYRFTGWREEELRGARVLDIGCGAGRFAEIALDAGAHVVALDYSSAVDACRANHAGHPRLSVVQGDIYALPFAIELFDFVYCLGVLQHTPDVRAAFKALPRQLKQNGRLAVDLYPKLWLNVLWPKYWLRHLTKRLPPTALFSAVKSAVPVLLPLSRILGRIPLIGRKLRYAVPVANYEGVLPLSERQLYEWSVLDTFDMLAPAHDHPQTPATLRSWFEESGLHDIFVERIGFVVGRGTR